MSDKLNPNKGELVVSSISGLPTKRYSLVKRGLQLIHELKKQQVRVQIGNAAEPLFTELFFDLIQNVIKDKYELKIGSSSYGQELLELAENGVIDIFILIMNNIWFPSFDSAGNRLVSPHQLIPQIKAICGRPVIALSFSGLKEDPYTPQAKLAADFYFDFPFKVDAFVKAFEKCLEILHSFDKGLRNSFNVSTGHIRI